MKAAVTAICGVLLVAVHVHGNTYTVTSTNDSGAGSLRQAILDANARDGADTIQFTIAPSGAKTIVLFTPLPQIFGDLTIDGTTQPGWSGNPIVELNGAVVTAADHTNVTYQKLNFTGLRAFGRLTAKSLVINRFQGYGVLVTSNAVDTAGTLITGCWVGLSLDGSTPLGNGYDGIRTFCNDCSVTNNVVAANGRKGISIGIQEAGFSGGGLGKRNKITGNYIGTDTGGTLARGNAHEGLYLPPGTTNATITGNVIAANGGAGITLNGDPDPNLGVNSLVENNRIGVGVTGGALGNGSGGNAGLGVEGIRVGAKGTTIKNNIVAYNNGAGIFLSGNQSNWITGGSIHSNGGLGIDISPSGVNPNDSGDGDTGANGKQNYPVLSEALNESTHTKVSGTLNSTPSKSFVLEFFSNSSCDPSGNGEGQVYMGYDVMTTDASGNGAFSSILSPPAAVGTLITATVLDQDVNTSEFSKCIQVINAEVHTITDFNPKTGPYGTTVTITGGPFNWVTAVFFSDGGNGGVNTTGGIPAQYTKVSSSQLTTVVPSGARTGRIRVESPYGHVFTSGDFAVTNPPPVISNISPATGPASGGTFVTISGSNFQQGLIAVVGSNSLTGVTVVNASTITGTTQAQQATTTDVVVQNPDGWSDRKVDAFTFYCTPDLLATITAPVQVMTKSTGHVASVPDGGANVTYSWGVLNGTIVSGQGTRSIVFTAGAPGHQYYGNSVMLSAAVTRADCEAYDNMRVIIAPLVGDFDLDVRSDLFWRHRNTGENVIWLMNGSELGQSVDLVSVGPDWRIAGIGDFQGDGKADILWRNRVTGGNVMWLMDGANILSGKALPPVPDLNWEVVGLGDFQGDGKQDVLWRHATSGNNAMWMMDGAAIAASAALPAVADTRWKIAVVGDFQADGKSDIIWRNASSGANSVWLMDGSRIAVSASLTTVPDTNWEVVGSGDLQGDGKVDLIWRHATSGNNAVWFMDGLAVAVSAALPPVSDPNWRIAKVADFQGDGKSDFVWRHATSGDNALWLMDGPNLAASAALPSLPVDWEVAGRP